MIATSIWVRAVPSKKAVNLRPKGLPCYVSCRAKITSIHVSRSSTAPQSPTHIYILPTRSLSTQGIRTVGISSRLLTGQTMPPGTGPAPAAMMGRRQLPVDVEAELAQIERDFQNQELTARGYEIRRSRILSTLDMSALNLVGERGQLSRVSHLPPSCLL